MKRGIHYSSADRFIFYTDIGHPMWDWIVSTIVGLAVIKYIVSLFNALGKDVILFESDSELQSMCMGGLRHEGKQYDD